MAENGPQQTKRTCPVCDEPVSAQATVCPSCNTDLSLFAAEEMNVAAEDAESLKTRLMAEDNGHLTDLLKAADGDADSQDIETGEMEYFECPECGKEVPGDANACPHCGVEFEMEEVFECPMCGAIIDVNVDKCPSCGAEFEEEESAEPEPADISSQIMEDTEPEKPAKPVSFAERLKQVKEHPDTAPAPKPAGPPKELSFAERMKAMKDGTLEESKPKPGPAPEVAKESEPPITKSETPKPVQEKPAPAGDMSFTDRMEAIKQSTQKKPAATTSTAPSKEPQVVKAAPDPNASKKDGYKELPRYIGEVKKLLLLANELKIDISASKSLINQAVTAGKNRDLENAIELVKEGKAGLERDIKSSMVNKLRTLQNAVSMEKKAGKDVSAMETDIVEIKNSMDAGDFHTASSSIKKLESQMASTVGSALPQAELDVIAKTLEDAAILHINVSEAKSFYDEAKMAVGLDDFENASEMAKKAGDSLTRVLPGYIASEMRKAKVTLREIKMMNVDITQPVNILKEANNYVREGDYCGALGSIKSFREFVDQSKQ